MSDPAGVPVELVVDRIGDGGDGVGEAAGMRVWVPFTVPGDRVVARLGSPKGEGASAALVSVLAPGPGRVEPACPHFGTCGGCAMQHLRDDAYIAWKLDRLRRSLERVGLSDWTLAPPARTAPGGRRRVTFTVRRVGKGGTSAGFLRRSSHVVVDVSVCPLIDPRLAAILPAVRRLLPEEGEPSAAAVAATMLEAGPGRGLDAGPGAGPGCGLDIVVELPVAPDLGMRERLADFARATDAARLSWRPSAPAGTRVAVGEAAETVAAVRPVGLMFGDVFVAVPAGGFVQASIAGERALVGEVLSAAAGASRVADLFSGAGTFALPLARAGARVRAVDGDAAAIGALAAAVRTAAPTRPGLAAGLACEHRDLFVRPLSGDELEGLDAVVFDPPRAGAAAQAAALARSAVPLIVAVSCNPATFARDAGILVDGGWRLRRVLPVDQFLWSPHLELVATFERPG